MTNTVQRVLVVDDSPEVALCYTRALERVGIDVRYVTNGIEAVTLQEEARASNCPFALLVLDWAMPVVTGIEVARTLRAAGDNVRIAFLTAYYDEVETNKASEVNAEVWGKPITVQALAANVRRMLETN
jgi:DNA-binding response OmpR family regulator